MAQVASTTGRVGGGGPPVTVAPLDELATAAAQPAPELGASALEALVGAVAAAVAAGADGHPGERHRPWLPPLPSTLRWEDLPAGAAGLVDDPDHRAQRPWQWDRSTGHLLCIGGAGSGVLAALTTTSWAVTARPSGSTSTWSTAVDCPTSWPAPRRRVIAGRTTSGWAPRRPAGVPLDGHGRRRTTVLLVVDGWRRGGS